MPDRESTSYSTEIIRSPDVELQPPTLVQQLREDGGNVLVSCLGKLGGIGLSTTGILIGSHGLMSHQPDALVIGALVTVIGVGLYHLS